MCKLPTHKNRLSCFLFQRIHTWCHFYTLKPYSHSASGGRVRLRRTEGVHLPASNFALRALSFQLFTSSFQLNASLLSLWYKRFTFSTTPCTRKTGLAPNALSLFNRFLYSRFVQIPNRKTHFVIIPNQISIINRE